jgi:hypothetical protein
VPPGGYWAPGQAPETAPPDGEEQRIVAYIIIPLGALATASGAAMVYLTAPGHCPERLHALGSDIGENACRPLLAINAVRTAYGAAGMITGFVLLGIGLHKKKRLEEWNRKRFRGVSVFSSKHGGGATLTLKF